MSQYVQVLPYKLTELESECHTKHSSNSPRILFLSTLHLPCFVWTYSAVKQPKHAASKHDYPIHRILELIELG